MRIWCPLSTCGFRPIYFTQSQPSISSVHGSYRSEPNLVYCNERVLASLLHISTKKVIFFWSSAFFTEIHFVFSYKSFPRICLSSPLLNAFSGSLARFFTFGFLLWQHFLNILWPPPSNPFQIPLVF